MVEQILTRALEIWNDEDQMFDDDGGDVMDAERCWTKAVDEILVTDHDALTILGEVVPDPRLKGFYWEADDDTFVGFIKSALWTQPNPFVEQLKQKIDGYEASLAYRKTRAEEHFSAHS